MEALIREALRRIRDAAATGGDDAGLETFLDWARAAIPAYLDIDEALSGDEEQRLSTLLGIAIWNAAPRPEQGWQPAPLPAPTADGPCPCGSGLRYRDCCEPFGPMPELPAELVWEVLLDELSESELQRALRAGAVPQPLLAQIAETWLDQDRPGRAVNLLEPLFAGDLSELDERFEPALDILCDAYDLLDHWKKKQAFLLRITEDGSRPLKAAAWQRFSTMFIDEGQFDYAHEAFAQAQRQAPDSPGTALLELTLLAAQHRDDHARARAEFWRHKLTRAGQADAGIIAFLDQAAVDPQEALAASHASALDPMLLALGEWLAGLAGREPLPYRIEVLPVAREPTAEAQLSLFSELELPLPPGHALYGEVGALHATHLVRRVERAWHRLFRASKPLSTQLTAADDGAVWDDGAWLSVLAEEPLAGDSLDILDDIATALHERPESSLPWIGYKLLGPLLARAERIVDLSLEQMGVRQLPWSHEHNRPALRLLFRRYLYLAGCGETAAAATVLERLLALNPRDNHGARAELMNHYLRHHQDEEALALAQRFPADVLADLAYGQVLALYRLGRQEHAARALSAAVLRLPRIPRFLLRKRVKRPPPGTAGFTPGADDQAWLYREAMRDVWEAEPGLLAWMKKLTA
jgi:hypothetical protein